MGRPSKRGLEYFPFDVDTFQDIKIRKLIKYQGGKAIAVYTLLLCIIYRNGYYISWDNELPFIVSELTGFDEAYIREVITCCLRLGLFDNALFDSARVLTSRGIQSRYQDIANLTKRKNIIQEYDLVSQPRAPQPAPQPMLLSPTAAHQRDDKFLAQFFDPAYTAQLEQFVMQLHATNPACSTIDDLQQLARAVIAEWQLPGGASYSASHDNFSEWSRHLKAQIRIKNRHNEPTNTSRRSDYNASLQQGEAEFAGFAADKLRGIGLL